MYIIIITISLGATGCSRSQSTKRQVAVNNKMKSQNSVSEQTETETTEIINTSDTLESESTDESKIEEDPEYQAFLDSKSQEESQEDETQNNNETKDFGAADATGRVGYHCDIKADKENFDGKVDIVVGDKLYTTQINDWYENFDEYEGKTVEIEGYYIDDYAPYTFVGRYGPSCPYCNGGYVSFEFYTQDDLSELKSVKDWIKVTGILRQGEDSNGVFNYIEVLSIDKMDKVGKDTVTN